MKASNPESRIPYLSLALLSQKVIDSLVQFAEDGTKPSSFETSLNEALDTLKTDSKYEYLRTLEEAWSRPTVTEVVRNLESLLDAKTDVARRRELASSPVENFSKLENQALSNFERPTDTLPKGIRALCQAP